MPSPSGLITDLMTDTYIRNVRQLLLEIPNTIKTQHMAEILDKMEKIGFKKCGFHEITAENKAFYSVGLINSLM